MTEPKVVLVAPENPANVGFAARVCANFGVSHWCQVGGCELQGSEGEKTGAPARPQLKALDRVDTLADALAETTHVVGFTTRAGEHRQLQSAHQLSKWRQAWGADAKVAFVFGRESRGLETTEVALCTHLVFIPTHGLSSLNLSHALAVALFAWQAGDAGPIELLRASDGAVVTPSWADQDSRQRLFSKVQDLILESQYQDRRDELADTLQRLSSLPLETRDVRVLERLIRHVRWSQAPR